MKRVLSFLLSLLLLFSLAEAAFAAAETGPVVLEPTAQNVQLDLQLYNKLLHRVNLELKQKSYSALVKKFIREILDYEAQYYEHWRSVYRDLPTLEEFVQENLIDVIPQIGELYIYDVTTAKGREKQNSVDWSGQTTTSEAKSKVQVFYTHPLKVTGKEHRKDIGVLAHELRHVRDRAAIWYTIFPTEAMEDIFVEGGASFHERYIFPMQTVEEYDKSVTAKNGMTMTFTREQRQSYPYYQTFYDSLVYLAGYHIVNAVGEGKDPQAVKRAIAKRYGKKTANTFWSLMKKLPEESDLSGGGENTFRASLEFFRLFLTCVKTDISRLRFDQPETVRSFMDIYRNLKLKVLPEVTDKKGSDITAKVFGTAKLDRLLADKVIASGAVGKLYKDEALNRRAVLEMLFCSKAEIKSSGFYPCFLPPTIAGTQYTFSFRNGKGVLTMKYADEDDRKVKIRCIFNEKRTAKRTANYL